MDRGLIFVFIFIFIVVGIFGLFGLIHHNTNNFEKEYCEKRLNGTYINSSCQLPNGTQLTNFANISRIMNNDIPVKI